MVTMSWNRMLSAPRSLAGAISLLYRVAHCGTDRSPGLDIKSMSCRLSLCAARRVAARHPVSRPHVLQRTAERPAAHLDGKADADAQQHTADVQHGDVLSSDQQDRACSMRSTQSAVRMSAAAACRWRKKPMDVLCGERSLPCPINRRQQPGTGMKQPSGAHRSCTWRRR
jgi:hypothetical protein